ncbi:MAG: hypothetical protein RL061_764, partial [Pseudomonadota bacterium]
ESPDKPITIANADTGGADKKVRILLSNKFS